MQYSYSSPSPKVERPVCWGKSYEGDTRECKQCLFNTTCKEEVTRLSASPRPAVPKPPQTPVTYYSQPYGQPRTFVPLNASVRSGLSVPSSTTAPRAFSPTVGQQPPVPGEGIANKFMRSLMGHYGAAQDPLFQPLWTAPAPFRPQLQGETFMQRFFKNIVLAALEAIGKELVLGIRQMILAPPTASNMTVDSETKK